MSSTFFGRYYSPTHSCILSRIIAEAELRLGIKQAREEAAANAEPFNPYRRDEEESPAALPEKVDAPPVTSIKPSSKSSRKSSRSYSDFDSSRTSANDLSSFVSSDW